VQVLRDRDEVAKRADVELAADRRDVVIHAVRMLIPRRQVLDAAARLSDRELTSKRTQDSHEPRNRSVPWTPQPSEP
jgi:hypothetical protein